MELQQIRYFLAVVDCGTFLAASEQVHVSQPTLSAGIRKLEESLNVRLFYRGSRVATLTPAGEIFLPQARQSYTQLMSVKSLLSAERKKINIGVLNTIPMDHITEIIRHYKAVNPHVFIELVVASIDELPSMLQSNKLDLIFTTKQTDSNNFTLLFEEQLKIVVSAQHPFSAFKEIDLVKLSGQPFIERIRCESWDEVHYYFQSNNIQPLSVCRTENDESVLALVAADLGVSIMPDRNSPYDVIFIPIKGVNISRPIGVCTSSYECSPHVHEFYETAVKVCENR